MTIEVPVITAILLVMLAMALTTELIGVHTALGAFVAGILIGQSPILTEHIEGRAARLHHRLFQPGVLRGRRPRHGPAHPARSRRCCCFTLAVIAGRQRRQVSAARCSAAGWAASPWRESLALATGLNARGSTEVIIASIGLVDGRAQQRALHHDRRHGGRHHHGHAAHAALDDGARAAAAKTRRNGWRRKKPRDRERAEDGAGAGLSRRQREWPAGRDAGRPVRRPPAGADDGDGARGEKATRAGREPADGRRRRRARGVPAPRPRRRRPRPSRHCEQLVHGAHGPGDDAIEKEAAKGYSIAFVGIEQPIRPRRPPLRGSAAGLVDAFDGPVAIAAQRRGAAGPSSDVPLDILRADGRHRRRAAGHRNRPGARRTPATAP